MYIVGEYFSEFVASCRSAGRDPYVVMQQQRGESGTDVQIRVAAAGSPIRYQRAAAQHPSRFKDHSWSDGEAGRHRMDQLTEQLDYIAEHWEA